MTADFELAVVGGGINGLAIARDAAVRGLRVVLLERDDVGCETSNWSSRMIHGGLRYLEQLDLRLVRESLRERETLFRTAPHLVRPMRIVIPVYRDGTRRWSTIRVGMLLYDLLSWGKSVPHHEVAPRDQVVERFPGLRREGLLGAVAYTDGQVERSERLSVELAIDAVRHGADVRTKTAVTKIDIVDGGRAAVLRTEGGHGARNISARCVVNATGPWVDQLVPDDQRGSRLVGGTKGSHVVLPRFPEAPESTVHFETETGKPLLCIPMQSKLLVGSTDELFEGDPSSARISPAEVEQLVSGVNRLFPLAGVAPDDVLFSFSGVRPLPYAPGKAATAITRRHRVHRHAPEAPNLFSIVGGKLTTHRRLAQETVDLVVRRLGRKVPRCTTGRLPLPGAATADELAKRRRALTGRGWDAEVAERLVDVYGALADRVVDLVSRDPRLGRRVVPNAAVIAAEVLVAVDHEQARSLADIVFRRLAASFDSDRDALVTGVGRVLAAERGWSPAKIRADLEDACRVADRMAGA